MNYTEEEYEQLEREERELTDEAIAAMLLTVGMTQRDLEKELRLFYQKYGKDGVITYNEVRKWVSKDDKRKRLTLLLVLIAKEFNSLHKNLYDQFKSFLTKIVGMEFDFFDIVLPIERPLEAYWGVDHLTWYERLEDDIDLWKSRIGVELKQMIHRGVHIDDVLEHLNKRFKSMKNVLEALGLSESTAIGSLTRKDIFKEMKVEKYQFYATLDERTCEICGAMHGTIFPMSAFEVGVTASPIHPRCRCFEIPIVD